MFDCSRHNWVLHRGRVLLVFVICSVFLVHPMSHATESENEKKSVHLSAHTYEPAVVEILEALQEGELERALGLVNEHIADFPKSRIGYVLKADILQAMVHNPFLFGPDKEHTPSSLPVSSEEKAETPKGLKHQLVNRWHHRVRERDKLLKVVPANLVDMGKHEHVIVSDMAAGRLYLYKNQNGQPKLVNDYYLSVGSAGYGKRYEGDNKTPVGVYFIYQHIEAEKLPDLYGEGAYPVNYPNRFDRALKRTGYGIWLHGTPSNTYARAPWSSEGCFVLSNDDLIQIEQYIDVDSQTPVILADQIEWVSLTELEKRRSQLHQRIEQWRQDWESLDTDAYLAHYSKKNFNFGTADYRKWAKRKQLVNQSKTFVQVDLKLDSLFLYPGEKNMFVVRYTQRYLSNNYAGQVEKEQYWKMDSQGVWRIVYES